MKLSRAFNIGDEMAVEFDDRNWFTSPRLLERGIGICFQCGNVMSVDDVQCNECGAEKFFIKKLDTVMLHLKPSAPPLPISEQLKPKDHAA